MQTTRNSAMKKNVQGLLFYMRHDEINRSIHLTHIMSSFILQVSCESLVFIYCSVKQKKQNTRQILKEENQGSFMVCILSTTYYKVTIKTLG